MLCARCKSENTRCVNDMLQVGYIAEIYVCDDCDGTIEVIYKNKNLCNENIKIYRYVSS